jgi:hypothetical protein
MTHEFKKLSHTIYQCKYHIVRLWLVWMNRKYINVCNGKELKKIELIPNKNDCSIK